MDLPLVFAMRIMTVVLLVSAAALAGCIENDQPSDPEPEPPERPSFGLPATITGIEEIRLVETESPTAGVWIDEERALLLSSHHGTGLRVTDISDPANATIVGTYPDLYARDADFLEWNGTKYAILAGGGEGIHVLNIDDPSDPWLVFTAEERASHNVAAVPGTPYVFNAQPYVHDCCVVPRPPAPLPWTGPTPLDTNRGSTILDISQGSNGTFTEIPFPADWNGVPLTSNGCHDVVVRVDLGMAYCAGGGYEYREGGGETFLWDISESVTSPRWVGMADNPFIIYHHQALASDDGKWLYINDEHIFPNCQRADAAGRSAGQPTAAMWVYDISDPRDPQMVSWLQAPDPGEGAPDPNGNCGSHFGDVIDGTDHLVWGWYGGGTLLIDVSDKADPQITEQVPPHGSIWDARYWNGHVYAADNGISVMKVV